MKKEKKQRLTTYLFPKHIEAMRQIASMSGKTMTTVLAEALDSYLSEVGAIDETETLGPQKEKVKERLQKQRG